MKRWDAFWQFLGDNPVPTFTLLGVLIAGGINVALQRGLHSQRSRLERNERVRSLLGQFVAAVNARLTALATVERRERQQILASRKAPLAAIQEITGKPPPLELAEARRRTSEAYDDARAARSEVMNLFFQISIVTTPTERDVIFACKALMAAETDDDPLYTNGYNLLLALSGALFNDAGRSSRRDAERRVKKQRPNLVAFWDEHVRARDTVDEAQDAESPSGAGHHGTDNDPTSETQGESDVSIDHDEPGSSPGDRQ